MLIQIGLFVNSEMWQVADGFDGAFLTAVIGLFLLVGIAFLLTRLPRELDRLAHFDDPDQVAAEVVGTRSEEHTSELQSLMRSSYAVLCLTKKKENTTYDSTAISTSKAAI